MGLASKRWGRESEQQRTSVAASSSKPERRDDESQSLCASHGDAFFECSSHELICRKHTYTYTCTWVEQEMNGKESERRYAYRTHKHTYSINPPTPTQNNNKHSGDQLPQLGTSLRSRGASTPRRMMTPFERSEREKEICNEGERV